MTSFRFAETRPTSRRLKELLRSNPVRLQLQQARRVGDTRSNWLRDVAARHLFLAPYLRTAPASLPADLCGTAAATFENSSRTAGSTFVSRSANRCTPGLFCSAVCESFDANTHDSWKFASATLPTQREIVRVTTSAARLSICKNRSRRLAT